MSLVTVGELKKYMDITFTENQEDAAEMILEGLQMEMEAFLRRPVEVMTWRETHIVPRHYMPTVIDPGFYDQGTVDTTGALVTSSMLETYIYSVDNSPIDSVQEIVVTPPRGTAVTLQEGKDFVVRKYGIEFYNRIAADYRIDITYKGGLDGVDIPYFKLVILRAASREVQNLHDDTVSLVELDPRNVAPVETGFSESELQRLRRWRRVRV